MTMTHTFTRTHVFTAFANPYLHCDECDVSVPVWHNNSACGCEENWWNEPCGHTAGIHSACLSWSPVDGCQCEEAYGAVTHSCAT